MCVTAAAIGPKWPAAAVLSLWVLVTPVLYGPSMLGSSTTDSGFELGTDIRSGATDVLLPSFCFTTQKPPCVIFTSQYVTTQRSLVWSGPINGLSGARGSG